MDRLASLPVDPHPELDDPAAAGWQRLPRRATGVTVEVDADGSPVFLDDLDADELLDLARASSRMAWVAERRKLRVAYQWCVLHADPDQPPRQPDDASWLGGAGTPYVDPDSAGELGAALDTTTGSAERLMADALNLRHRLPLVWARVDALEAPPWKARRLAELSSDLGVDAVAELDRRMADVIGAWGAKRIEEAVVDVRARFEDPGVVPDDPVEDSWGVRVDHTVEVLGPHYEGTSHLDAVGDTLDIEKFDDLVGAVAEQLLDPQTPGCGPADLQQRRARALGVIADRAFAGRLVLDPDVPVTPGAPVRTTARTRVYVHVRASDLAGVVGAGSDPTALGATGVCGHVEGIGPVALDQILRWMAVSRATVLPVLDLGRADGVDQHDPPDWMRELVVLRDPTCVFPWCGLGSRRCDQDHILPYDPGGPPGQTRPDNLAPLCRRHHRYKTRLGWRYTRDPDGSYLWTSPHGRQLLVERGRTYAGE